MTNDLDRQPQTFGDWSYIAIEKHFTKILDREPGVLQDSDPEELHQMRVGMRRLRSAIAGFSPALDLPKAAREKNIGKIARILGKLRDIDVLQETLASQYRAILPTREEEYLEKILAILSEQRKDAFKQVKKTLNNKTYLKLKKSLQKWLENPQYQAIAEILIQNILPDLLLPQISQLLLHPGWWIKGEFQAGKINFSDSLSSEEVEAILEEKGKILHDLRKKAKRSRYNLELFTQFYEEDYHNYVRDIKALQTILGDLQDAFVLKEFAVRFVDRDLFDKMPTFTEILREKRYEKWQQWRELQSKFTDPEVRKNFHFSILKPSFLP